MVRAEHYYTDVTACVVAFMAEAFTVDGDVLASVTYGLRDATNYSSGTVPNIVVYDPIKSGEIKASGFTFETGISCTITSIDYQIQIISSARADDSGSLSYGFGHLKVLDRFEALFNPVQPPSHVDDITFDVITDEEYTDTTLREQLIDNIEVSELVPAQSDGTFNTVYAGRIRVTFKRAEDKF